MAAQHRGAVGAPVQAVGAPIQLVHPAERELGLDQARTHIVDAALAASDIGDVGLELEMHLVDLAEPSQRVPWDRLTALVADLPAMPAGSAVTLEPGGQVELSTPPQPGVAAAIEALVADRRALGVALGGEQLGLVALGADPARSVERLTSQSRYVEMEQHFMATGSGDAGRAMMCSTAALQLNVEAGPMDDWSMRISRMHRLGPVLVAISACSPWLAGNTSGWQSMRQQVWGEIDQARCGPLLDGEHPEYEWASYALAAPVMLVRDPLTSGARAVIERVSFESWIAGDERPGRPPTIDDLDYHLSTLFPPLRPRGFLELRCLDAVPDRWWPGLAGLAATLLDDEYAAVRAAQVCAPLEGAWTSAARDGLADPAIARAANACVEVAVDRAPVELKADMEAYAELVVAGRTPGDEIRERAEADGPLAVLIAESRLAADIYA
jgi:ergothioneine biosynthesis glutamate--cysteine ligase EgtA